MKKKIMYIVSTIRLIVNHPLSKNKKTKAILRYFKWVINTMLNPYPVIYPFTENSKMIVQKGMFAALGNLYCGLLEYQEMSFVLHFLRENDLFIDIGANIGSYTILASAHVGCETVSIEPVPSTFSHLIDNININRIQEKVTALNFALGYEEGTTYFTKNLCAMNHVATDSETDTITVPIFTLDKILAGKCPILLKIDVEGFETGVLKGASQTLNNINLKSIIIELNDLGKRYGYDQLLIHQNFIALGFVPYQYNPVKRQLVKLDCLGSGNAIYIRDIEFVNTRVQNANKVKLPNNII